MQISPFYSLLRGIAVEDLWHDNDECQIGLSITSVERIPGKNLICKHCPYCALLNSPQPRRGRLAGTRFSALAFAA